MRVFAYRTTPVQRGQAFWIRAGTAYNRYFGPFEVELSSEAGVGFGTSTGQQAVLYAVALVPVSLMTSAVGITGAVHLAGALLFGLAFLTSAVLFAREQSVTTARRLLLTSVFYLPAVFGVAVPDPLFLR